MFACLTMSALAMGVACGASAARADGNVVAFVDVAVVSMKDDAVLQGQTVLIEGDRIALIGPAEAISVPPDATVIDGSGRYLIPGLSDMHVHVHAPFEDGPMYLNAGVTTVLSLGTRASGKTMADVWQKMIDARDLSYTPEFIGPTLYTVGPVINGGESPDEVERIVRKNAEHGFDFVKVHGDVSAEAFDRLHETARELGIRVTGHGQRHRGMEPVYAHQQDLVHAEEYLYAAFNPRTPGMWAAVGGGLVVLVLLSLVNVCWWIGALWRRLRKQEASDRSSAFAPLKRWVRIFTGAAWLLFMGLTLTVTDPLAGVLAGNTLAISLVCALMLIVVLAADALTRRARTVWRDGAPTSGSRVLLVVVVTLTWVSVGCTGFLTPRSWRATDAAMERIARDTVAAGIWVTPNLVLLDYVKRQNSDEFDALNARDEMRYVRPAARDRWINHNQYRRLPEPILPTQFAIWQSWTRLMSRLTGELHKAGVPLLAGSDAGAPHGVFPGSSLHEELSLLVEAGLSPYEALRTATANPAIYLKAEQEFGTIAEGLRADLVLLKGNPFDDINNTRTRVGVMKRGRWFASDELETALERLAEQRK